MKTNKNIIRFFAVAVLAAVIAGCAKPSSNDPAPAAPATDPGVTVITGAQGYHPLFAQADAGQGSTAWIYLDGTTQQQKFQRLTQYVSTHPLNNPVDFAVNIQMGDQGNGTYGGQIQLGYYDTNAYYIATLDTGTDTYQAGYSGGPPIGTPDTIYNRWFTFGGKQVFHAFVSDDVGAVVLVIDGGTNLGDGGGYSTVSGSLWFKNFQITQATERPDERCWFIFGGPYQCRTFLYNGQVNTTSTLYPSANDGYIKLGTFSGIDKVKAFGQ